MGEFEDKLNGILSNPKEMEKIMALAQSFMGGGSAQPQNATAPPQASPDSSGVTLDSVLGAMDPGLMQKLAKGFTSGVGTATLLRSVTPHLKDTRQSQLSRAITIAQMVRVARAVFSG